MKITPSDSVYYRILLKRFSSAYLKKRGILYFLPEQRSRMRVYLFVFPGGDRMDENYTRRVKFGRKLKVCARFKSRKKKRVTRLTPISLFSKNCSIKIETELFCSAQTKSQINIFLEILNSPPPIAPEEKSKLLFPLGKV